MRELGLPVIGCFALLIMEHSGALGEEACPGTAHAHVISRTETRDPNGDIRRKTKCDCDASYENQGGACVLSTRILPAEGIGHAPIGTKDSGVEGGDKPTCLQLKGQIAQLTAAADRSNLASDVYHFYEDAETGWTHAWKAPKGYKLLSNDISAMRALLPDRIPSEIADLIAPPNTGYRAAVYEDQRSKTLIVAFRGTTGATDWKTNVAHQAGLESQYFRRAEKLSVALKAYADARGVKLEMVGHSLGGALAVAGGIAAHAKVTTFNSENANQAELTGDDLVGAGNLDRNGGWVTNYVTPGDPLTKGQALTLSPALGKTVRLPEWTGFSNSGAVDRHSIQSIRLALQTAITQFKSQYAKAACGK